MGPHPAAHLHQPITRKYPPGALGLVHVNVEKRVPKLMGAPLTAAKEERHLPCHNPGGERQGVLLEFIICVGLKMQS